MMPQRINIRMDSCSFIYFFFFCCSLLNLTVDTCTIYTHPFSLLGSFFYLFYFFIFILQHRFP